MEHKMLFVASTSSHILHFHLPYLQAFQENGWTIHCACGGDANIPHAYRTLSLPFEKKMSAPGNFRAAGLLRRSIRKEQYDIVIVHTSLAAFFTRLALLGMRKRPKVINMVHGYLFDDQTSPLKRTILLTAERLTAPVTDLLLTMNRWDHEMASRHALGKKVANIPGIGVNFSRFDRRRTAEAAALKHTLGISEDAFVLIYPAEFSARKSQHVLLHAMTALPERAVLVLPGNGILLDETKKLARDLDIGHRVFFPGYVTDMPLWYQMADCAVSASRIEGLPFNVMEAMYASLPVVASSVKGHTDLLRHRENGLLYPYGDWKACAAQVQQLMDDSTFAQALSRQASEDSLQYALDQVFTQVMEQYVSLIKA